MVALRDQLHCAAHRSEAIDNRARASHSESELQQASLQRKGLGLLVSYMPLAKTPTASAGQPAAVLALEAVRTPGGDRCGTTETAHDSRFAAEARTRAATQLCRQALFHAA